MSDHCPLILKSNSQNRGSKPFRFFNCWLEHVGFKGLIESAWNEFRGFGWNASVLKEKFKFLKQKIKSWNVDVFGNVDIKIKHLEVEISSLDARAETVGLSEDDLN